MARGKIILVPHLDVLQYSSWYSTATCTSAGHGTGMSSGMLILMTVLVPVQVRASPLVIEQRFVLTAEYQFSYCRSSRHTVLKTWHHGRVKVFMLSLARLAISSQLQLSFSFMRFFLYFIRSRQGHLGALMYT